MDAAESEMISGVTKREFGRNLDVIPGVYGLAGISGL
jgi:hypothetical protein